MKQDPPLIVYWGFSDEFSSFIKEIYQEKYSGKVILKFIPFNFLEHTNNKNHEKNVFKFSRILFNSIEGLDYLAKINNIELNFKRGQEKLYSLCDSEDLFSLIDLCSRFFIKDSRKSMLYLFKLTDLLISIFDTSNISKSCFVLRDTVQNPAEFILRKWYLYKGVACFDMPNSAYISKGYLRKNLEPLIKKSQNNFNFDARILIDQITKRNTTSFSGLYKTVVFNKYFHFKYIFKISITFLKFLLLDILYFPYFLIRLLKNALDYFFYGSNLESKYKIDAYISHITNLPKKHISHLAYCLLCIKDSNLIIPSFSDNKKIFKGLLLNLQPERTTSPNSTSTFLINLAKDHCFKNKTKDQKLLLREHPANYTPSIKYIIRSYNFRDINLYLELKKQGFIFSHWSIDLKNFEKICSEITIWSSSYALEYFCRKDLNKNDYFPKINQIVEEWYSDLGDIKTLEGAQRFNCAKPLKIKGKEKLSLEERIIYLSRNYYWIDVLPKINAKNKNNARDLVELISQNND